MAKDITIGDGDGSVLFDSDMLQLDDVLDQLVDIDSISPTPEMVDVLVEGIENPATGGEVLGMLISSQNNALLEQVFDDLQMPGLDGPMLIDIAQELDPQVQVRRLGELAIGELNAEGASPPGALNIPNNSHVAVLLRGTFQRVEAAMREETNVPMDSGDGGKWQAALGYLQDVAERQGIDAAAVELRDSPELANMLVAGGPEAVPFLVELANDAEYGNQAIEILHRQGSEIIPELQEAAAENPGAAAALRWAVEGEAPDLHELNENRAELWIERLADPDEVMKEQARQSLHALGEDAISALTGARENVELRAEAEALLEQYYKGETGDRFVDTMPSVGDDAFQIPDLADANAPPPVSGAETMDVDLLSQQLANPETSLVTLNALIDIGAPAIPALCKVLLRARK